MKIINVCIVFFIVLFSNFVMGAFSTPYLENNTIVFNGTFEYDYNMVFQNPANEVKYMKVVAITGGEWMEPSNFTVKVDAQNYDTQKLIKIKIPRMVIEDGVEKPLEYNKKYSVEYGVSSGDLGGNGMVPITSQVTKRFNVVVYGDNKKTISSNYLYMLVGVILILLILVFSIYKIRKKRLKEKYDDSADSEYY